MKGKRRSTRRLFTRRRLGLLGLAVLATALAYLVFETRVAAGFEARDASAPTRIIARPLILRPGDRPSVERVRSYLERVGYRSVSRARVQPGEFRLRRAEWTIGRRALRLGEFFDPGGEARVRLDGFERIRWIRDAEDREIPGLVLDPEVLGTSLGSRGRDRVPVVLGELPDHLIEALLTVEDRRFREHGALDPRRVVGAALANLKRGRVVEGASTITQQLARTLFLTNDRTLLRKLREVAIAIALERRFSKDRLLEAYLNHIYLGQDGAAAIHGFGRAAQYFFGTDASALTLGQSALLVGIVRGPSVYSPRRQPERARARRDLVLAQLRDAGAIDDERYRAEIERPLGLREPPARTLDARFYLDFLADELEAAGDRAAGAGLTVVSSLEPKLQRGAERAVGRGLERLERSFGRLAGRDAPLQAALVAIEPRSGEIVAMVGGRSYAASQFNRAAAARRQPGSAFKPIVALAAVGGESGPRFTLASVLEDEPLRVETPAGVWAPSNADREFVGPIRLRDALEASRNVPFARLGMEVGPERVIEAARALGIRGPLAPVPSLALGASEVTLLELTSAYATLAAEGRWTEPHAVRSVLGPDGGSLRGPTPDSHRAVTPAEAYLVTSMLRGVVERGTGRGVREAGYHGPVAAKSGTTNGARDAWFVGYTPELAVGVWVGFDDGTPIGVGGSRAALPIFADFLRSALGPEGGENFRFPEGVEWVDVDEAGQRAGWGCRGRPELFLIGTAPRERCDRWEFDLRDLRRRFGSDLIDEVERLLRRSAPPGRARRSGPGR